MAVRKTEAKKARDALHKASQAQRKFILKELSKEPPTRVRVIADVLDVSTQRIYAVKAKLVESGELSV